MDEAEGKINLRDPLGAVCLHGTEEISVTFAVTVRMQIMILSREPGV